MQRDSISNTAAKQDLPKQWFGVSFRLSRWLQCQLYQIAHSSAFSRAPKRLPDVLFIILQVDEGGSIRFFQNMWTSFLKARLVCGFPEESLYFNRLQDIYVLHADDWHDTRVYALFTSSWCDSFPSLIVRN